MQGGSFPASQVFPILRATEVLEACHAAGLPLTPDDLSHPTPSRVQSIYEWWLHLILHITMDDCKRAAEEKLDHIEHAVSSSQLHLGSCDAFEPNLTGAFFPIQRRSIVIHCHSVYFK